MSRLGLLALLLALVLGVTACGGGDDSEGESTPEAGPPSAAETAGCEQVEAPTPKDDAKLPKPKEKLKAGGTYVATVVTSCGEFKIALDAKQAPRTGGPGYTVVEKPPGGLQYVKGVVAMAKGGNEPPGASGSQWFVVTAEDAQLPPDYALLGKVTEGQDVVDKIGAVPTTPDEQPTEPVVIRSVKVSGP